MLVGGGSGGHILPLLAVARKLRQKHHQSLYVVAVVDNLTQFANLLESSKYIDKVVRINAGKFRRYPNQSIIETILDVKTTALNIRDAFKTMIGIGQARSLMKRYSPDAIFIKGGFVGVPVGIVAHLCKVPFITHDSDASPGLANRIIGRWAHTNTVGMDKAQYAYSPNKIVQVGIPIAQEFKHVSDSLKIAYRKAIDVPIHAKMIFITGGSQGSKSLNKTISTISQALVANKNIYVVHQTGVINRDWLIESKQYITAEYFTDLYRYSGAADVILSRAGSSVAEFAVQGKAVVVVPAPQLASEHQIKNAEILASKKAVIALDEVSIQKDPNLLLTTLLDLLDDKPKRQQLIEKLKQSYPADADDKIADILIKIANKQITNKKK